MLNQIVFADILNLRVRDTAVIFEERRQPPARDKATFVDRGREHRTAILSVPDGIIRAASEKGDAKRCASDDHEF